MARKTPVWERLVREGWVATRKDAERWILSGSVRAGGQPVHSAGQKVSNEDSLVIRGIDQKYVSKGGFKLEGALADFAIPVEGRACIDAGASTGGFTDCLLRHGAARVYAVDVGYGQLTGSLRNHPAVVNLERTNISDAALLSLDPSPTLGTVDLSYLTLRKAIPIFAAILKQRGEILCLVKPLFEIDDAEARRTGQVPPEAYAPLLMDLSQGFILEGYAIKGITNSPVTGNNGTLEFFIWIALDGAESLSAMELIEAVECAVHAARNLPAYHKS